MGSGLSGYESILDNYDINHWIDTDWYPIPFKTLDDCEAASKVIRNEDDNCYSLIFGDMVTATTTRGPFSIFPGHCASIIYYDGTKIKNDIGFAYCYGQDDGSGLNLWEDTGWLSDVYQDLEECENANTEFCTKNNGCYLDTADKVTNTITNYCGEVGKCYLNGYNTYSYCAGKDETEYVHWGDTGWSVYPYADQEICEQLTTELCSEKQNNCYLDTTSRVTNSAGTHCGNTGSCYLNSLGRYSYCAGPDDNDLIYWDSTGWLIEPYNTLEICEDVSENYCKDKQNSCYLDIYGKVTNDITNYCGDVGTCYEYRPGIISLCLGVNNQWGIPLWSDSGWMVQNFQTNESCKEYYSHLAS